MSGEMKNCPFCGSDSIALHRHRSNHWRPQCDACFANISVHGNREAALKAWNTRHADEPQTSWQPIETAPKDGTPLLAANSRLADLPPVMVRWLDEMMNPDTGWCDAATASGDALYYNKNYFDLWMPAPRVPRPHHRSEGQS